MFIDKYSMLEHLRKNDEVYYYSACVDISLSGENYKVIDILYFVKNENKPLSDYIQFKKYDDKSVLIYVNTNDSELLIETVEYLKEHRSEFGEIEMYSEYDEMLTHNCIANTFIISDSNDLSPIYYIRSEDELNDITQSPDVSITLVTDSDRDELAAEVKAGRYNEEDMGPGVLSPHYDNIDTKIYVLRVKGRIAGYLRAECGFSNIYDIGWVHVQPEYRGNGYAVMLVLYFSHDCFANGDVPHYGYAVSEASARVAEKCGYIRTKRSLNVKRLEWKSDK